jgi:hypothetical protein
LTEDGTGRPGASPEPSVPPPGGAEDRGAHPRAIHGGQRLQRLRRWAGAVGREVPTGRLAVPQGEFQRTTYNHSA